MVRRTIVGLLFVLGISPGLAARETGPESAERQSDVRVLIDISGSMKQNDPNNLRIPALNLLTQLLPDGHQAGVWTFGQQVNLLIPLERVDAQWRETARRKATEINSVGLFTNIGGVLEKAFADYQAGTSYADTHFILLTDGVVDISKDAERNAAERERVLSSVLTKFRDAGARIHTVALSRNADLPLLERLALETQGLAAVAESSEDLNRLFVSVLDQAVPAEQVPLTGNTFGIDGSIEEFTVLVFTEAGTKPVELLDANGERYSQARPKEGVRWYRDRGYDLVTVTKPKPGQWTILADPQPGSRVTVVTDLRMVVSELPSHFYPGDELELTAAFFEDQQQILDAGFLGVVDVDVKITNEEDLSGTKRISLAGQPPADGVYRDSISKLRRLGRYTVTVQADGKTFQREHRQTLQLQAPVEVELEGIGQGAESRYRLTLLRRSENIMALESQVTATISSPDGRQTMLAVPFLSAKNRWELEVTPTAGEGQYLVQVSLDGMVKGGRKFQLQPGAVSLLFPRSSETQGQFRSLVTPAVAEQAMAAVASAAAVTEPAVPEPAAEPMVDLAQAARDPSDTPAVPVEPAPSEAAPTENSTSTWLWAGVGLLGLAGGSGAGVWAWRRRRAGAPDDNARAPAQNSGVEAPSAVADSPAPDAKPEAMAETSSPVAEDLSDGMGMAGDEPEVAMTSDAPDDVAAMGGSADEDLDMAMPEVQSLDEDKAPDLTPDEIADQILAENRQVAEEVEEEFNLEDFDIAETDGEPPAKPSA